MGSDNILLFILAVLVSSVFQPLFNQEPVSNRPIQTAHRPHLITAWNGQLFVCMYNPFRSQYECRRENKVCGVGCGG